VAAAWLSVRRPPALTDDFISYWAASRALAAGNNPYDAATLLSVERSAGWQHESALPTWYGPWILVGNLPIAILPYWPARLVWMALQIVSLLWATSLLWRLYDGPSRSKAPFFLAVTFAPAVLCLIEGQITPFILLGLAVFLRKLKHGADWSAGAALAPLTAKPLTLYLVWLALIVWTVRTRRVKVLAGLALTAAALVIVAVGFNRDVIQQWLQFGAEHSPLVQAYTATTGTVLRRIFGIEHRWLAFVPMIGGVAWWSWRLLHRERRTEWSEQLPTLAIVSLLSTPFAWSHDALLLLPFLLRTAARKRTSAISASWLVLNGAAVGLYPLLRYQQAWYLLYPLSLLWIHRARFHKEPEKSS
jgi:hypothetical protein